MYIHKVLKFIALLLCLKRGNYGSVTDRFFIYCDSIHGRGLSGFSKLLQENHKHFPQSHSALNMSPYTPSPLCAAPVKSRVFLLLSESVITVTKDLPISKVHLDYILFTF